MANSNYAGVVIWMFHCFDLQRPFVTNDVFVAFELQWYKTSISYVHIFVNLIMQNIIFEETWSICVSIQNIISTKPDFPSFVKSDLFSSWVHQFFLPSLASIFDVICIRYHYYPWQTHHRCKLCQVNGVSYKKKKCDL